MKTDERNEEQEKKCNSSFCVTKGGMKHLNVWGLGGGAMWLLAGQEDVSALLIYET